MGGLAAAATALAPAVAPVAGTILSSVIGGKPSAPSLPPAPAPAAPATAPDVATTASPEPVVDVEAARTRAAKRRAEARQKQLFSLSGESDDDSVVLTKTLLGG
jgi:hypothetical protein